MINASFNASLNGALVAPGMSAKLEMPTEPGDYLQGTLASYLDRLASAAPEPGGGSVAALVGALAAGLLTMVADLTLGREKFAAVHDDLIRLRARAEELRVDLQELVTLDAKAYGAVATAMKLPRENGTQEQERHRVLEEALVGAAKVPLRVAEGALEVARLCPEAAEKGNPNAVSDAGVAVLLADAAAQAAALNVRINLALIEDEAFNHEAWAEIEAVLSETAKLRDVVLAMTYSKLE